MQAYEIYPDRPSGELGSALHSLTRSEAGRQRAREIMAGDPHADEKINLLAMMVLLRGLWMPDDVVMTSMSDSLRATGWRPV